MESREVLITDIQKFAVNDGPGFRTNVFLKGCPLHCQWCHNPETISATPQVYWKKRLCVQCGECLEACPNDAIEPPIPPEESQAENSTYHKIIREKCDNCMACVTACKYKALEVTGRPMPIDQIIEEVEKDRPFYENSGGGLTISGGEPTQHPEFTQELLEKAHKRGIHTCLDTNGFCRWEILESLLPYVDIFLYDLKHLDPEKHREKTGVTNELILENLKKLSGTGKEIWVRIPVLPGYNDSLEFHKKAAEFLAELPGKISRVDLLPFHNYCEDKYNWLGLDWKLKEVEAMEPSFLEIPLEYYRNQGLHATVGGSGFENENQAAI